MATTAMRAQLLEQLIDGVKALTSSQAWERHLQLQTRFHRYSYRNVLLIAAQRPDATSVAGFHTWKKLGRQVRRGEKAIWILAPMTVRRPADGDDDTAMSTVRGFRLVAVFDVAQTDGRALPAVCTALSGEDRAGAYGRLVAAADTVGFTVVDHRFAGSVNGDCCHATRTIRVEATNTPAQRIKTLAHELAHALLHETFDDRSVAELEAESCAYVICRSLGIDSGRYSFGYVAGWAGGGDEAAALIRSSCRRIQQTAAAVLELLGEKAASAA